MFTGPWTDLLMRQTPAWGPLGWDEVVVGHDFGFLGTGEVRTWARDLALASPCEPWESLLEAPDRDFEARLWAAASACTGKAPRPGGRRWAAAQDRWRVALLREALAATNSAEALATAIEGIYEAVGCPEDMVGLWKAGSPWQRLSPVADPAALEAFLRRREPAVRQIA